MIITFILVIALSFYVSAAGLDEYTKLLLHMDGDVSSDIVGSYAVFDGTGDYDYNSQYA